MRRLCRSAQNLLNRIGINTGGIGREDRTGHPKPVFAAVGWKRYRNRLHNRR